MPVRQSSGASVSKVCPKVWGAERVVAASVPNMRKTVASGPAVTHASTEDCSRIEIETPMLAAGLAGATADAPVLQPSVREQGKCVSVGEQASPAV